MTGSQIVYLIEQGLLLFIILLQCILIARALLSWLKRPNNRLYRVLCMFSDPIVRPFQRLADRFIRRPMMFDISTLLAFFALYLLEHLITLLFRWYLYLF